MSLKITSELYDSFRVGDRLVTPGANEIGGVRVESKAMEVLLALADAAPAVLSSVTLLERIWPDVVVVDNVVYQAVAQLRKALGDEAHAPRYIATIPRRGYRVIAEVTREVSDARAPSTVGLPLTDALLSLVPKQVPDDAAAGGLGGAAQPAEKPGRKSIAVLPFTNRSSDQENQYLCDGLAEELIGGFAKMQDLRVASQLSTFALKNQNFDIETIGQKLRVNHVLSGSVQKSGNRVRVNVSLTDIRSGDAVWSERYDGTLDDVFGLQEEVARKVVNALQVRLGSAQAAAPLIDAGTRNTQAYEAFLLGMHAFRKKRQRDILEAMGRFQQAGTLDPDFGRAHWFDFLCHQSLVYDFGAAPASLQAGRQAAIDAMRRTKFQAPAPRIQVDRWRAGISTPENELAREAIDKINHPDPEWVSHQYWQLAISLGAAGLIGGCLDYMKLYLELNHVRHDENTNASTYYVTALELLGHYDESIDYYTELLAVNPDALWHVGSRSMLYSRTGQYEKAEQDLAVVAKVFPRNFAHFYHLYWTRQVDAAREYYAWMDRRPHVEPLFKCYAALLMGDLEKGLDMIETQIAYNAFGQKCFAVRWLPNSIIRQVWAHPRHRALMARAGVTDAWRDELLVQVNEVTPITGIRVRPDEVV